MLRDLLIGVARVLGNGHTSANGRSCRTRPAAHPLNEAIREAHAAASHQHSGLR